jgi:hypothetical protein
VVEAVDEVLHGGAPVDGLDGSVDGDGAMGHVTVGGHRMLLVRGV